MGGAAIKYILTEKEINSIVNMAAQAGVKAYREETRKAEKRNAKRTDKVEITRHRLMDYRAVKRKVESEVFTKDELDELRFEFLEDLMGQSSTSQGRAEKKRDAEIWAHIVNVDYINKIDRAYEQYREECDKWGSEEAKRRCRELYMLYMDDTVYTTEEIARIENVSERTAYRDVSTAVKRLAAYLYGFL